VPSRLEAVGDIRSQHSAELVQFLPPKHKRRDLAYSNHGDSDPSKRRFGAPAQLVLPVQISCCPDSLNFPPLSVTIAVPNGCNSYRTLCPVNGTMRRLHGGSSMARSRVYIGWYGHCSCFVARCWRAIVGSGSLVDVIRRTQNHRFRMRCLSR
jgi:hypothetical protein